MYLLDTNIFIYYIKNRYPQLTHHIFSLNPNVLFLSTITVFELEYGAEKSNWGQRTRENLATMLAPFHFLDFTTEDAVIAGKIRGFLEKQGTGIGPYDTLIASQALSRNLTLVTHNTAEFSRVPNLRLEDWTQ